MERAWRGRRMRQALKLDRQSGGGGELPILSGGTGRRSAPLRCSSYTQSVFRSQSLLLQRSSANNAWLVTMQYGLGVLFIRMTFVFEEKVFENGLSCR